MDIPGIWQNFCSKLWFKITDLSQIFQMLMFFINDDLNGSSFYRQFVWRRGRILITLLVWTVERLTMQIDIDCDWRYLNTQHRLNCEQIIPANYG